MSVQTRSLIWGLPQFQKKSPESAKATDNFSEPIAIKSDRRTAKTVSKILVQLSKTQSILVDYTNDQANILPIPKIKNKWSGSTNTSPVIPVNSTKIINTANVVPKSVSDLSLKLPNWSLNQTKLQFVGYLNDTVKPSHGQVGDFYLTMNGNVWLKESDTWKQLETLERN